MGATPTSERTPESTRRILNDFKKTTDYQQLHEEAGFIDKYKNNGNPLLIHQRL